MNGMFQPMMPMYQPQPTDGISSAVSQISGGMGDEYTNRLLGALGLGDVGQYQMQQPVYQPMPFYNPYMNPYAGMFSPFMQPSGPMFDTTASNYMGGKYDPTGGNVNTPLIEGSLPSFGLMGFLSELFGGDTPPSTTDDAYSSSDGGSMSSSQAASAAAADTDYGPSF